MSVAQNVHSQHGQSAPWSELREQFEITVRASRKTMRTVAAELGMSPSGLSLILRGITEEPHPATVGRIEDWIARQTVRTKNRARTYQQLVSSARAARAARAAREEAHEMHDTEHASVAEQEMLAHFGACPEHLELLLSFTSAELAVDDRRKAVFAMLNGLKRAYIRAGGAIPPSLFELEQRYLAPEVGDEDEDEGGEEGE